MMPRYDRAVASIAIAGATLLVGALDVFGMPRSILLAVPALVAWDQWIHWSRTRTLHHPSTLFAFGWILPYTLTFLPLQDYVFVVSSPSLTADLAWAAFIVVFHAIGFLVESAGGNGDADSPATELFRAPDAAAVWTIVLTLFILSNAGFAMALASSGFAVPLFQPNVTDAASAFFGWPGTSTLFNFGRAAIVLGAILILTSQRSTRSDARLILVAMLLGIFLVEQLLYGKRMGILLALVSVGLVASLHGRIRPRQLAAAVVVMAAIVLVNAYIRAKPIFDLAWQNSNISAFSDLWQYALAQPAIYVTETFNNLGKLADAGAGAPADFRSYLFNGISEVLRDYPDDLYSDMRSRGKMTTILGSAFADGGDMLAGAWAVLVSVVIWILHALRHHPLGAVVYAYIGAHYCVLWTDNFWLRRSLYDNVLIMALVYLMVAAVRGSACKLRSCGRSES